MSHLVRTAVAATIVLFVSDCADLKAVRKFSDDTTTLTGAVALLIQDSPESCRRRLAGDTVIRNLAGPDQERAKQACDEVAKAVAAIADLNNVTLAYAKALGALADDKLAVYSADLRAVKASAALLKDGADKPYIDKSKLDAAGSLADLILKAFTEGYRQREIAKMLTKHDDLAKQADFLKRFISRGYVQFLTNEEGNLESTSDYLTKTYGKTEPLRARELKRDLGQLQQKLADRKKGAQGTLKALDDMVAAHQKLREDVDNLSPKELLDLLDNYGKSISDVRKSLQAAF